MPIHQVQYQKKNGNARYDTAKKVYIGYRIDVVVRGKRHRDGGFGSRRDAQNFIDRLKSEARDRRNGLKVERSPKVSELFAKRLERIAHHNTKVLASRVFNEFESLLEDGLRVTEIRASHFQQYVNSRDVSAASIHRELAELSAAFKSASEIFPELEDYAPPKIKRPRKAKTASKHVITREEKDAIVANLQDTPYRQKIGRMFAVAWFLGLRYGEIVKLKKTDLKKRTLRVVRWKTGDVTIFEELPDEVLQVLKEAIAASNSELIFPDIATHTFYPEFRKAVEAAGLVYGSGKLDNISFHGARHSFVTRAMEVADLKTVGSLSSHSDTSMILHYTHTSSAKQREMMRRLYGDNLKEIYNKVASGEMDFEAFKAALNRR